MDFEKLFDKAKPYLEKNDLGSSHTSRVQAIARDNFLIPKELEDLTVCSIILHDIGGSTIKEQYENGPKIAASLLQEMGYDNCFIDMVSQIIAAHHDHPEKPSLPFQVLFDSDKIVMFSPEEFSLYDARPGFDWNKVIQLIYSEKGKELAKSLLIERVAEKGKRKT